MYGLLYMLERDSNREKVGAYPLNWSQMKSVEMVRVINMGCRGRMNSKVER